MPYIDTDARKRIDSGESPQSSGELNYAITVIVDQYIKDSGGIRYGHINDAIGVLECAKMELYRRIAAPYEDEKIASSGEVYSVLDSE